MQSINFPRRQSVPNVPSSTSIQVIKLSRHLQHQSLQIQDTRGSIIINNQSNNSIRNKIPSIVNRNKNTISTRILDSNKVNLFYQPISFQQNSHLNTNGRENYHRQLSTTKIHYTTDNRRVSFDNPNIIDHCRDIALIERSLREVNDVDKYNPQYRNKKRGWFQQCCIRSSLWIILSLVTLIVFGGIIAATIVTLLSTEKPSTTIRITSTMTITSSTTTETTTITDIPCLSTCNSQQSCIDGICINVGYLACTLTWSRPGDGDIDVETPNGNIISYKNKGPSASTDYGELDRDDQVNEGPENVYWTTNGPLPPTGTYHICFEPYKFDNPNISIANPLTIMYRIVRPSSPTLIFIRTFTSTIKNSYNCSATASTLIGSFTYP
ncbi:unnamed protein product [Adineta ricciae]|uniref:Uncharacterized protein n=1 Tax=Adineta ricciae TaxID=249248 RepID=A0A814FEY2_ADIRI|nr:unnamed protein product [Adineta ricciae]